MNNDRPDSLLVQATEITVMGIMLTAVTGIVNRHFTGENVVIICCFLACVFVWKMVWPVKNLNRYFVPQLLSMVMMGVCVWWLIYMAENTRAGWYRTNVLQQRIAQFVHNSPAYVIIANADGNITHTSSNIEMLTGYSPQELTGMSTTVLMRDIPASRHLIAFGGAVKTLRQSNAPDSGWTLQGTLTVGLKHKNGSIIPVRIFAGGIRWSTDIQFSNDIDMFAVFVPVSVEEARREIKDDKGTTLGAGTNIIQAPPPPRVPSLVPTKK